MPSNEFRKCKALYLGYLAVIKDHGLVEVDDEDTVLNAYFSALDDLIALPPSQQKLSELMALAVIESKGEHQEGTERDLCAAEHALRAALQTFEALQEAA